MLDGAGDGSATAKRLQWNELRNSLKAGDVVVSMLPATIHPQVVECCLDRKAHFVSSSYLSPEVMSAGDKAAELGLCVVCECGLDPGLDHWLAHLLVERYQNSEGFDPDHQHFFRSYCGGLTEVPNEFRYKFSWSPSGVLRALTNPARWIADGKERQSSKVWESLGTFDFSLKSSGSEQSQQNGVQDAGLVESLISYPNRDSVPYIGEYGMSDWRMTEFVRGTLRYQGWDKAWEDIFALVDTPQGADRDEKIRERSDELWREHQFAPGESDRVILAVELEVHSDESGIGDFSNDMRDNGRFGEAKADLEEASPNRLLVESNPKTVWHEAYRLDAIGSRDSSAMARLVSLPVSLAAESVIRGELPAGVNGSPKDLKLIRKWMSQLESFGEEIYHQKVV